MTGYNASVSIGDPGGCPVALASRLSDGIVESVARTSVPDRTPIEEFSLPSSSNSDPTDLEASEIGVELTPIAATEDETVYRFERDPEVPCACEIVERNGGPVTSIRAMEGELIVSLRTTSLETITDVVSDLRECFDGVRLRNLLEVDAEGESDLVYVDRDRLTDRQRTALETAYEMGYFEYPRAANATEVAAALGISRSTFTEHLTAAQSKLLETVVER